MKIFVEITSILKNKNIPKAGIGGYTENICGELIKQDKKNIYTLFGLSFLGSKEEVKQALYDKVGIILVRWIPGRIWNYLNSRGLLPPIQFLLGARPDLIIYTNFRRYPQLASAKSFVVIHDIGFVRFPATVDTKNQKYLTKYVPLSIRKADRVIAVSEFTKSEIIQYYKVDPDKIIVTHNAVNTDRFKPTKLSVDIKKKYNLPDKYILFMGTIEPRKNIERLVEAYNALPLRLKQEYPLVLAGGRGWLDEGIERAIQRVKNGQIIRTGYIDDVDMAMLYSGATIFCFPSLYEGFGIPILEAMACGAPVLTGQNSSLPEVGGDGAYYIDEKSTTSITRGITKLLQDQKLRQELIKKGKKQITKFSWEKSAQVIIDEINKLK